jgi:hypothetical protein
MRVLWRCWTDGVPYDPIKHHKPTASADRESASA